MKYLTKHEWIWAGALLALTLVWAGLEKAIGLHGPHIAEHPQLSGLFLLPVLVLYTLAIWGRRQKEAVFPWKSGFVCGLGVTLIAGFFSPAVQWVIHTWISPGYFAAAIAHAVAQGQDRALMEQFFNLRAYIAQSLIGSLLMGTLVSALVGFLLRKSPKK